MSGNVSKDLRLLRGTLLYIEDVELTLNRFGRQYEAFYHDRVFFNAVSMALMQIGELSKGFSEEFKQRNAEKVDWGKLNRLRNMLAHSYSAMNERHIFNMATVFIPVYAEFCKHEISLLQKKIN